MPMMRPSFAPCALVHCVCLWSWSVACPPSRCACPCCALCKPYAPCVRVPRRAPVLCLNFTHHQRCSHPTRATSPPCQAFTSPRPTQLSSMRRKAAQVSTQASGSVRAAGCPRWEFRRNRPQIFMDIMADYRPNFEASYLS
eukprot:113711-Prymnesium_polylepis.1